MAVIDCYNVIESVSAKMGRIVRLTAVSLGSENKIQNGSEFMTIIENEKIELFC